MLNRRSVLAGLAGSLALPSLGQAATPTRVGAGLLRTATNLGIRVNGGGQNTIIEFFDYNCTYCRHSMRDFSALLAVDPRVNYLLVNYGVLGQSSADAARVALAFAQQQGAGRYLGFHRALLGSFGAASGERALSVAEQQGCDRNALAQACQSSGVESRHQGGLRAGQALGLVATPAFIINGLLFHGQIDLDLKRRAMQTPASA